MSMADQTITAKEPKPRDRDEPARVGEPAREPHHRLHPPERRVAVWGPLIAVTVLAILIIGGVWKHVAATRAEEQFAQQNSQTVVNVQVVHRNRKAFSLELPGSVDANQSTTLYARTNGYLGKWYVDIGDNVKEGQLLAEIETPDVEQQLRQAEGTLNQAKSNFEIARVTAVRWQDLYVQKVVSAQDNDTQQTNYQTAAAAVASAQANVNLYEQELSFNRIVAPFSGRITNRFLDIGALVSEGTGSGGTQIYSLEQTDPLLIYVYVPQTNAPMIHVGSTAKLIVREYPGRDFVAIVTRTAGAIDPSSRTLLTELQIPNKDGTLYAGMYGEIRFSLTDTQNSPIIVPANAYIFRTAGPQVVVIGPDNKVHWQTIEVGRDYGTDLEALSGLKEGDRVVVNPTDDLVEGMQVKAQEQPEAGATGMGAAQPAGSPKG
jgi:RND family efflux transporter MFP subunit